MTTIFRRTPKRAGLSPGTVAYLTERKVERVRLTVLHYDGDAFEEREVASVEECLPYRDAPGVSWIRIEGLHETALLERLGAHFGLHPLTLEDIVSVHQRPKRDDYESYLYVVLRTLPSDDPANPVREEQVSLALGPRFVLSFQETQSPVFDPVRDRLRKGAGRMRRAGADYLAYALLDTVVDGYYEALERVSQRIEQIDEGLVQYPSPDLLRAIHQLKREMIVLRKAVWPLREVIACLERDESALIRPATRVFLRDVYDHAVQVIDAVESFRDMLSGMQDLYLSSISNRMNEVMKVLTIIATIFVPLTFLAGIYGMNFEHFPELKWRWGYLGFWGVSVAVAVAMLAYFRRKRWL
jgi:magnesium transporter